MCKKSRKLKSGNLFSCSEFWAWKHTSRCVVVRIGNTIPLSPSGNRPKELESQAALESQSSAGPELESKIFWLPSSACRLCAPCGSWLVITKGVWEQHCYKSAALLKLERLKIQYCAGLPGLSGEVEFFPSALFSLLKQTWVMLKRHLRTYFILISVHFRMFTVSFQEEWEIRTRPALMPFLVRRTCSAKRQLALNPRVLTTLYEQRQNAVL